MRYHEPTMMRIGCPTSALHAWRRTAPALAALWTLTACTGADEGGSGAGSPAPSTFVVAAEPEVSIGVQKGEAAYELSGVSDATRLSDGTIIVADCQSAQLRWFDVSGRFLRSAGRSGQGPGEFVFLRRLFPLGGDTVGAYDGLQPRITIYTPDGSLARVVSLGPMTAQSPDVLGRLSNGLFVARRFDYRTTAPPGTLYRTTDAILLLDESGQPVDSIVGLPASDMRAPPTPSGPYLGLRLQRNAVISVLPDGVVYGGQDAAGLIELDGALERVGVTTTVTRPEPVTEEVKQAYQAMMDAGDDKPPEGIGTSSVDEYPDSMPAFGAVLAGRDGRLWVEDPVRPGRQPLAWTAYEDGETVARVEIPPRFFPFEFGRDWVLGVSYDELAVEQVELRRFVPGEPSGRVLTPREAAPPLLPMRCGAWASR